ncbi:MAG: hypothetical protein H6672_15775 [Anaerolineaceae bacterium]|nr:hypothetical protein [Anaerolineaceae bacterium]
MYRQMKTPQLGRSVLVIMDGAPGYLEAFRVSISRIPEISRKFFTLFCCCPTYYWEHGGADSPGVLQEIEAVWAAKESESDHARHCLDQARAILHNAGVPDSHILSKISAKKDSLMAATMSELGQSQYSGVIISRYRHDIINRLHRKGITDVFRSLPKVEVLTLAPRN